MATDSSAKPVYLHVGVPKSGTSFIQAALRTNKRALLEQGVLFPSRHKADMFHAALAVTGRSERWGVPAAKVENAWSSMCARSRGYDGTVVISSEFLCGARPTQIREALTHLEGREVHVVVTARDLARQLPAEWQEGVKHGRSVAFPRFLKRVMNPERRHPHAQRFWNHQDLPAVLGRWADGVSPERLHVVTCPQRGADPRLLWERFCSVVGVDAERTVLPDTGGNPSLGINEIEVLRMLNRSMSRNTDPQAYGRMVKGDLVSSVLRRYTSPRMRTPTHLLPYLQELAKTWRADIEAAGYDVVGDLAELEPVDLEEPDTAEEVSPRKALAVAADALAEVLQDADRLRSENASMQRRLEHRRPATLARRVRRRAQEMLRR